VERKIIMSNIAAFALGAVIGIHAESDCLGIRFVEYTLHL
jgi:hypothetical protein